MKVVIFCHSIASCWNHGNAHFLRGVARELVRRRHDVQVFEPADGWSRTNALHDHGAAALDEAAALIPGVNVHLHRSRDCELDQALDGADLVLVHEWTAPALVAAIGHRRIGGADFTLLFHDTHHRAVTARAEMDALDLQGYDGILAFGEVLSDVYRSRGWGRRVFTWHEAADTALFKPLRPEGGRLDLVWIGNWGDDERSRELDEFLITPAMRLRLKARVHGVRYPDHARARLAAGGIEFAGWLPNHRVPAAFAQARATVHVPRRPYVAHLPGIPTIRVFEALACGIPLVCSPWSDTEGLFPAGAYLTAGDGETMRSTLSKVLNDSALAAETAAIGLSSVLRRHTCAHRVDELTAIVDGLGGSAAQKRHMAAEAGMEIA